MRTFLRILAVAIIVIAVAFGIAPILNRQTVTASFDPFKTIEAKGGISCATGVFISGFTRNSDCSLATGVTSASVQLLPYTSLADSQAGVANGSAALVGYTGSDTCGSGSSSCYDRVRTTNGALNNFVTGGTVTANAAQAIEYYSGVCFQLSGQSSATCPTVSAINGCTATNVLPCFWDVGGTFGGSLVGHTIYGVWFHSGQTMQQLSVQLVGLDTATGTFSGGALILGDLINGSEMGVDQYIPIGGPGGRKIVNGLVFKLFAIGANTTPLSNSAGAELGVYIR